MFHELCAENCRGKSRSSRRPYQNERWNPERESEERSEGQARTPGTRKKPGERAAGGNENRESWVSCPYEFPAEAGEFRHADGGERRSLGMNGQHSGKKSRRFLKQANGSAADPIVFAHEFHEPRHEDGHRRDFRVSVLIIF